MNLSFLFFSTFNSLTLFQNKFAFYHLIKNKNQQKLHKKLTSLPIMILNKKQLFAYGITAAGKTFTIMGTETQKGAIPNTLDALFYYIKQKSNCSTKSNKKSNYNQRPMKAIKKSVFILLCFKNKTNKTIHLPF